MARSNHRWFIALVLLLSTASAQAGPARPTLSLPTEGMRYGGSAGSVTSSVDSLYLIGPWSSGAAVNGQFEDRFGVPAWNGWTHEDLSVPQDSRWQVSTYQADNLGTGGPANLAAWCGEDIHPACSALDIQGGYGNNYNELLVWSGSVADPDLPCTVTVSARLNLDLESGYDYLRLRYRRHQDVPLAVLELDGRQTDYSLGESFVIQPEEYLEGEVVRNRVVLEFQVTSDEAFSDEDCLHPSAGACQIDDITVTLGNGGAVAFEDFQSGVFTAWQPEVPTGVGDFSRIFWFLEDIDPCLSNYTPQACFIDDGQIVPGTGGAFCVNWCYGPGGYIVNTQGGLAGPEAHLSNQILSPVVTWPAQGAEGALLTFSVYNHEDLDSDSPGMFYTWHVRSIDTGDAADLPSAPWVDRNFLYYGPAEYRRLTLDITDLLESGTTHFQLALRVQELGYWWGWNGDDGYPAPYFDNVRLVAFPFDGPALSAREVDLAQDGFPAAGFLDQAEPANNSVRFDMAANIAPGDTPRIDPGDSIVVQISARGAGAQMVEPPLLRYDLDANPAFDACRTSGLPASGYVPGRQVYQGGAIVLDRFCFDLPDTGFFFPGDVLHYYIQATSYRDGSFLTRTLPADTTGFTDFSGPLAYDPLFTVRALPSVFYHQSTDRFDPSTRTLLWVDGGDLDLWTESLADLNLWRGQADLFVTRAASSAVGNGLGSRASVDLLDTYETLLYTCGNRISATLCNGDPTYDGSNDVGLLDAWMARGEKSMFLTGDNLAWDLHDSGPDSRAFLTDWLGVDFVTSDVRNLITNQTTPLVLASETVPYFFGLDSWIAYGGCLSINTFDAVEADAAAGGMRLAEFASPMGTGGYYPFAAAVLKDLPENKTVLPDHNSAVVSLPYDLEFIYNSPDGSPPWPLTARQVVLNAVLDFFGEILYPYDAVEDIPLPGRLEVANYPNPFNPVTSIEYNLPRDQRLSVKIFNLRGQLVSTLVDERRPAGPGQVLWNGTDARGAEVSSGVYFYELRAGGETRVGKMALLK